ncbi:MAG TPA: GNAT family N-acetyltransferase [Acidimicrobiales bacterium]|nr:GNAT family N-acetyltransferase [Acidimicrobiales bacterium]
MPRLATDADLDLVARICAAGFAADPLTSWLFPDPATRDSGLRIGFGGLARSYLGTETSILHILDDACVTMWRSPDHQPPPEEGGDGAEDESPFPADVQERFRILGELMEAAHPHDRPHWYLNVISTLPERHGQGLGARALRAVLDRCDADGVPAYLESSNPRNMSLYRRHGFDDHGTTIDLPDGPSLYPMWRDPR